MNQCNKQKKSAKILSKFLLPPSKKVRSFKNALKNKISKRIKINFDT